MDKWLHGPRVVTLNQVKLIGFQVAEVISCAAKVSSCICVFEMGGPAQRAALQLYQAHCPLHVTTVICRPAREQANELALQVLAHLHSKMCSHGDVKPDSIMADIANPGCPAMLMNFALAHTCPQGECSWHSGLAHAQTADVQQLGSHPLRLLQATCPAQRLRSSLQHSQSADRLAVTS